MPPYLSEESPPSVTLFLVVLIAVWGGDYAALLLVIWGVDEAALSSVPLLISLSCRSVKGTRCKGTSVFWKGSARASVALGEDCSSCRSLWYQVPILPHWASSLLRVLSWHCSLLCVSWGGVSCCLASGCGPTANSAWNQKTLSFLGKNSFLAFRTLCSLFTASCLSQPFSTSGPPPGHTFCR